MVLGWPYMTWLVTIEREENNRMGKTRDLF